MFHRVTKKKDGPSDLQKRKFIRLTLLSILMLSFAFYLGTTYQHAVQSLHPAPATPLAPSHASPKAISHQLQAKYGTANEKLRAVLAKVAINGEVMAAVSNHALMSSDGKKGTLRTWIDSIKRLNITNYFVIAIDDQVAALLEEQGVPYWRAESRATADKAMSNHGISARKFNLVKEVLKLGYSLLLSDVDIVVLQNPFEFLYRDEDVEALSDGYDPPTAYMYDDVYDDEKMGWSRYAHTVRIFVLNSGLFYLRPNSNTIDLMDRITARLDKEKAWDQAVFNEEIWFPSSPYRKGSHISVRVMDIYRFVNSKTLFQTMRHDRRYQVGTFLPVMVHVNYHPDKEARMVAIWKYYVDGVKDALDSFPLGVGR